MYSPPTHSERMALKRLINTSYDRELVRVCEKALRAYGEYAAAKNTGLRIQKRLHDFRKERAGK